MKAYEDLIGKVAIVTGAAQGIGQAVAQRLAQAGMKVVVNDIVVDLANETADNINKSGGMALCVPADMARHSEITRLVKTGVEHFGRLDAVVHCAYWATIKNVVDLPEDDWDKGIAIMLKASYLLGKYAIPEMLNLGSGAIVNIASVHGFSAVPNYPVYAAAKGGLVNLTRQMAVDCGPHNIRVNAICPGWVQVRPFANGVAPARNSLKIYPMRRPGQPSEIANAALFLVSNQASFINGHALVVDGGLTAQLQDGTSPHWSGGKLAFTGEREE
jgi:NAD(P)-dependent dehydrogenase (short-subunit alcohol dehydrogenase family)